MRTAGNLPNLEKIGVFCQTLKYNGLARDIRDPHPVRKATEEIFAGRKVTFILDQCHALEYAAAAVRALTQDKEGRTVWMARIKQQLNDGEVARVIADLKPHRKLDEAVEACIQYLS